MKFRESDRVSGEFIVEALLVPDWRISRVQLDSAGKERRDKRVQSTEVGRLHRPSYCLTDGETSAHAGMSTTAKCKSVWRDPIRQAFVAEWVELLRIRTENRLIPT